MIPASRFAFILAGLALGAGLVPAAAQIAPPVVSQVPGRAAEMPFELFRGNRIFLFGRVNGVETPMILDSGAGVTTLDKAFARRIGLGKGRSIRALGTGGVQQAELVRGVTIEAGNLRLANATVAVIDLSAIEKAIGRPLPVVLGREVFMHNVVAIDFQRQRLRLASWRGFVPPAGATEVRLKRDGTLHYLPVSIDGLPPVDAALDLGAGGVLSLSRAYHQSQPRIAALPFAIGFGGGVGGVHEMKRVTLPRVEVAGFTFSGVPAELGLVANGPYAGRANAGIQLFKPFELTLDLGRDRLWLKRNGAPLAFAKDRAGMFVELGKNHLEIRHVSPGSPAARAGLKAGDRLTAVNGQRVDSDFYASPMTDWASDPAGTPIVVTTADGRNVPLTLADYY